MIDLISLIIGFAMGWLYYYETIAYNPYTSELFIGHKGSGKTTHMAKTIQKYNKLGWKVFCNKSMPGSYFIETSDIGRYKFPPNSLVIVDEAGIYFNNRKWKELGMGVIKYMKLSRHEKNKLILYTQSSHEIDVSFMRVCDKLHLISNWKQVIGKVRHLKYKQVLIPASDTAEARITDDLVAINPLLGGISFYLMPIYWKYFDSFDSQIDLEEKEFEYIDYPPYIKKKKTKKSLKGWNRGNFLSVPSYLKARANRRKETGQRNAEK